MPATGRIKPCVQALPNCGSLAAVLIATVRWVIYTADPREEGMVHTLGGTQQDGVRFYQAAKMTQFWNFLQLLQLVSSNQPQWEPRAGLTQG